MKFRFIDDMLNRHIKESVEKFLFLGNQEFYIELPFSENDLTREDFYSCCKKYKTIDFNLHGFYGGKRSTVLRFTIFNKGEYIDINNICERMLENE